MMGFGRTLNQQIHLHLLFSKTYKQTFLYQELAAPSSSPQSPRVNFDEKKDSQHQTEEKEENGNNGDNTGTALREVKGENGKLLTNNNVDGELSSDCSHPASGRNMNILRFKALAIAMQILNSMKPLILYHS